MQKNSGFTLIELLATTAIVGVLASLLITGISKAKNKARDVQCLNNQRSVRTVLESDYQDVVTDYNQRYNPADINEMNDRFNRFCSSSLMRDPYLGNFGIFIAKPVTCPYAFGDGTKRAGFSTLFQPGEKMGTIRYVPYSPDGGKEIKAITYSYGLSWNFLDQLKDYSLSNGDDSHFSIIPVVSDSVNTPKNFKTSVRNMFPQIEGEEDKTIVFNDSVLHPHKGVGRFATFGSGEQKWIKFDGGHR